MFCYYILVVACIAANSASRLPTAPYDIRVDHYKVDTTKDLIINTARPRFSWKIAMLETERNVLQVAYQLQIKSRNDQWDSKQVMSSHSIHVSYMGFDDLQSATFYQFRLRIWTTQSNQTSPWTNWIHFRTFMFNIHSYILSKNDSLMWIGSNQINMNELRKEFQISNSSPIQSAVVYISGLGYYELYVNGDKVDISRKLDPGWTVYEKRTLLVSFDLSATIKSGMNAVGVRLGNGWYGQEQYTPPVAPEPNYGPPRFIFFLQILFDNGEEMHVYSDSTWIGRQNSILHDSIYNGEFVDSRSDRLNWSRVGFTDLLSLWIPAELMSSPINESLHGQVVMQDMPPIRAGSDALHFEVTSTLIGGYLSANDIGHIQGAMLTDGGILKPIAVWSPTIGVQVFDLAQNMAGWCRFRFYGARGVGVYIRHGEILTPSIATTNRSYGEVYTENLLGATQSDTYVLHGDPAGEIYEPTFTYHGFRYVSIINAPNSMTVDDVECLVVHSETTLKGHFISSNPIINQIQHNIQWSQLNNLMSLPTDCPQREERKGWLGDAALTVNEALYNFDLIKLYINFLHSIVNTQGTDGAVPDTVPFSDGDFPADPNWGTALPTIAWQLYRHYNDVQILSSFYSNIRLYVESVYNAYKSTGLANLFYSYGDWVPPAPQPRANESLTSSFAFMHDISLLINMSQILGYTNDTHNYMELYQQLAEEFHRVFFNSTSHFYADGTQTSQILALALPNVVPSNIRSLVLEHLVSDITQKNNHVATGIIGTAQLYPLLSDNGYHDLALELISSITYPSYGYMSNNPYENATALWEIWNAPFEGPEMNSRNHIMYGSIGAWFYSHLAGIEFTSNTIVIRPRMASESKKHLLRKVDCQLSTLHGLVHVAYTRDEPDLVSNSIRFRLTIPANTQARVIFEPLFSGARCVRLIEGNEVIWPIDPKLLTERHNIENEVETGVMIVYINSGQYEYQVYWE
ncbi:unnamed protein product [Adineta steineri]|uniref:alpha-L-rhamnosidase n=1 Tax=Adineta steineri TaxID=433720 RepID=A0A814QX06_9BILA|nr:unnamed protein product [Adineta steineri]CAF1145537.1 unnamed protein product [Adineta steineri]